MLHILIAEDEPLSRMFIRALLSEHFPETEVVSMTATEDETVAALETHRPDVVLMDIELQTGTGFGALQRTLQTDAYVIFTTALDHDATAMLTLCGVPYISKPVDVESLAAALARIDSLNARNQNAVAMTHLRSALQHGMAPQVLCISDADGEPEYVSIADIISICQCEDGCTLALRSGRSRTTRQSLKEIEVLLKDFGFFRTHMHCIVARRHIVDFVTGGDAVVRLCDGSTAPVSPKKLEAFRAFMADS